jgi:RNA-directed DNA polymerase
MTETSIKLQDLRRKIYVKAKSEKDWQFWGLYVHVCKMETLREAYKLTKQNKGAPGIDGVTFEQIEAEGIEKFLQNIRTELLERTYLPLRYRKVGIPKGGGKLRILNIPPIRDRVVQGALKLILEPIFEADFQPGSYGYRPKRNPHEAVEKVAEAIVKGKTRVIDVDLKSYFDTIRHDILFSKIAKRVNDKEVMRLVKLIAKTGGKRGIAQGSPISPLFSNIYLNEVDKMLEKAKRTTNCDGYMHLEYARWADDIVILIDGFHKWRWLERGAYKRLQEELEKLDVTLNKEKTRTVDLEKGETFDFLGFTFRRQRTKNGKWWPKKTPKKEARKKLLKNLKEIFRRYQSQPTSKMIEIINRILKGWVNYFRTGHSSRCFGYVKDWVYKKVRRHLMKARKRSGFGWKRWSREWVYGTLGLYSDYKIRRYQSSKVPPVR